MECYDMYAALEGCHRIRAAKELGLIPEIEEVEYSETMSVKDPSLNLDLDNDYTIAELVDDCHRRTVIDFN
jgi:hypothetical protein